MKKFLFSESVQRVLLGMVFGFVLGVILYQSSRIQMKTPLVVQAQSNPVCNECTQCEQAACAPPNDALGCGTICADICALCLGTCTTAGGSCGDSEVSCCCPGLIYEPTTGACLAGSTSSVACTPAGGSCGDSEVSCCCPGLIYEPTTGACIAPSSSAPSSSAPSSSSSANLCCNPNTNRCEEIVVEPVTSSAMSLTGSCPEGTTRCEGVSSLICCQGSGVEVCDVSGGIPACLPGL